MSKNNKIAEIKAQPQTNTMLAIIEVAASNKDVDPDKMQKLLDMQLVIMDRQAAIEYNSAFAEMQTQLPTILAKGEGHNKSKFAKKEDMNRAVNPILAKYGFSLSFSNTQKDGFITTKATLRHRGGHCEYTEMTLKDDSSGSKNVVQATGSSQSYGERYTMKSILNLTIIKDPSDDDGAAHTVTISDMEAGNIEELLINSGSNKDSFLRVYISGVDNVKQIPLLDYNRIVALLEAKITQNAKKKEAQNADS